jgi:hypothetical protein
MSLNKAFAWVGDSMTAFEAISAAGIGMIAGLKLPAFLQSNIAKYTGYNATWMTSGAYTPYLAGAAATALLGFALYGLGAINKETAMVLSVAGVAINAVNVASTMTSYVPSVGLGGYSHGFAGGYLGNAEYDTLDAGMFGMHEDSAGSMFGASTKNLNFY